MTAELAVSLGNAGDLAELLGIGIQVLEQILTGIIEVDFVCRDQSAEGQRIVFDELDAFPVSKPLMTASFKFKAFAHLGKTRMIEDFPVVTPMK